VEKKEDKKGKIYTRKKKVQSNHREGTKEKESKGRGGAENMKKEVEV